MKGTGRGSVICDLSGLEQRGLAAESGPGQLLVVHTQARRDLQVESGFGLTMRNF